MKQFLKNFWLYFKFHRINSFPLPIVQWDTGLYLHLQDHTVLLLSCFSSKKSRINNVDCRFLVLHQVVLSLCLLLKWILQIIDLSLLWELWELFVICMSEVRMGGSLAKERQKVLWIDWSLQNRRKSSEPS